MLPLPYPAEELVPHRLPLRQVETLVRVEGRDGSVAATVAADSPLVDEAGVLEGVAMVELIAQGYAALKGYLDRSENKPVREGFLVGVKKLELHGAARSGDQLRIEIHTLAELNDFAITAGEVWRNDVLLASGELKVWIN
jgi:predicted hotdog family 3-hydroxylacyl-ACP dehydratase